MRSAQDVILVRLRRNQDRQPAPACSTCLACRNWLPPKADRSARAGVLDLYRLP
jgi:hypothetical protein